jgi:hypothetical protein
MKHAYVHGVAQAQAKAAEAANDLPTRNGRFSGWADMRKPLINMEPSTGLEPVTPSLQVSAACSVFDSPKPVSILQNSISD